MMPLTLTLIRHGQSESNLVVHHRDDTGTPHPNDADIARTHTSEIRLTPKGVRQAQAAGVWMQKWLEEELRPATTHRWVKNAVRFYVSPYTRAMETAAHLQLGELGALWRPDMRLCERNWGSTFDSMTYEERLERFSEMLDRRQDHAFFWRPGDGQTLDDVYMKLRDFISSLHRNDPSQHVVAVCHGEVMHVWRMILEHGDHQYLKRNMTIRDPQTQIRNCRIIQYSRIDENGIVQPFICRARFVNPEAPDDSKTNRDWATVERVLLRDEDLMREVEQYPRLVDMKESA